VGSCCNYIFIDGVIGWWEEGSNEIMREILMSIIAELPPNWDNNL
jgi:hypothetical protein